jgi:hypothetical protein
MTRAKPVIRVGESPKARIFTGRWSAIALAKEEEDLSSVALAKEEAVAPDADIIFVCPTSLTVPPPYHWRTQRQVLLFTFRVFVVLRLFHVEQLEAGRKLK